MVVSYNPFLKSDYYLITCDFLICNYMPEGKYSHTRCLSDDTVTKFKDIIPTALNLMSCLNKIDNSFANGNPFQIDHLVDSHAG